MSRAARKIAPRAPWVAHPDVYDAPQQPAARPPGGTMRMRDTRASQRVQQRVNAATDLSWTSPPPVDPATPAATVWLSGEPVRVPLGWGIAFSSRQGRDALYLLSPKSEAHVLFVSDDGEVRELAGIPDDVVTDILRAYFPKARR